MSNPPEEGESSSPKTNTGFYASLLAKDNSNTPHRPSFLDDTSQTNKTTPASDSTTRAKNSTPVTSLYSIPSATPITSLSTTFGSIKRKRTTEVVTKPSFNVSEFVSAKPHLPKFGTSLKLGSLSSQSKFYTGRTMFGGSSSLREDSAKRRKISPVSVGARTNVTSITAKPYSRNDDRRTLTSKTAESILKTLNKICTPANNTTERSSKPSYSKFSTNFSSLSKQLREKRKSEVSSILSPPVSSLNHVKSAKLETSININPVTIPQNTPKEITNELSTNKTDTFKPSFTITKKSDSLVSETVSKPVPVHAIVPKSVPVTEIKEVPTLSNTKPTTKIETKSLPVRQDAAATTNSKSFKMKRQLTRDHYSVSKKDEEPVNSMPEVTQIQPLVIKEMPKFDLKVNPASATMFTPIPKPTKPVFTSKSENVVDKYSFSTPKTVNDKNIECKDSLKKYSFISPIAVQKPEKKVSTESAIKDLNEKKPVISEPPKKEETKIDILEKPKTSVPTFSFKLPQKAAGSWDCPTCMINNKPDSLKCVACTEPKPGSKVSTASISSFGSSAVTSNTGFSFGKTSETAAKPESNGFSDTKSKPVEESKPNPFAKFSKAAQGSWSCPICMVSNASDILKCLACAEPKPGSKSDDTTTKPAFNFGSTNSTTASGGFSFGGDAGKTTNGFSFCAATSSTSSSSGFSFGDPKPVETVPPKVKTETVSDQPSSGFSAKQLSSTTFGSVAAKENPFLKLKKADVGSWGCPTCMIQNKPDSLKCVACTEPKPGSNEVAKPEPPKPIISSGSSFQKIAAMTNPLLNLKKPEEGSWDCPTCMITNKPDSLNCVACTEPKPVAAHVPVPTGFSFGKAAAESTNESDSFSFGKPATEANVNSGFSFGKPATEANGNSGFSFGKPATEANSAGFSFGKSVEAKAIDGFSFGKPASEANAFSFKPPASETPIIVPAATEPHKFSFGAASSGFSFGQPPAAANGLGSTISAGFSFGTNAIAEPAKDEPPVKVTNLFGNQDVNKVFNGGNKPASTGFNFGGATQLNLFAPKVNGDASVPAPAFDSIPQFNFAAKPTFTIGAGEVKPAEPPAAKINFNPASMSTPNFNFGSVTSAATLFGNPNPNGQFSFANNNNLLNGGNNDPAKVNLFASPAPTANLFNIGGGGANANAQQSMGNERRKIKRAHRRLQVKK